MIILTFLLCGELSASMDAGRLPSPADAAAIAQRDALQAGDNARYFRYVWNPSRSAMDAAVIDVAVNTAWSQSRVLVRGYRLSNRQVLRYDLRQLAPFDLSRALTNWEKFAEDEPYFLQNGFAVAANFAVIKSKNAKIQSGTTIILRPKVGDKFEVKGEITHSSKKWLEISVQGKTGFILASSCSVKGANGAVAARTFAPHVASSSNLIIATGSQVPIVRGDYFVRKSLSTLDGGLYYQIRNITKSPDSKVSDLDHWLQSFAGVTEDDVAKLRSDQKVAMFRSEVTAKPRAVLLFTGAQGRASVNQGLVAITQDMADGDVDPKADPIANLLRHKFEGIEAFAEMQNGMIAFALFTGDLNGDGKYDPSKGEGKLVNSVPDNIAKDHTVPAPHTARLQPAISCIRCHSQKRGTQQPEGWLPLKNDVTTLLRSKLDVFGEKSDGFPDFKTLDRLAGLYAGDLTKPLTRARDDLSEATLRLTQIPATDGKSTVSQVHTHLSSYYRKYWFDTVKPVDACVELGFEVSEENAVKLLNALLPPLPADEIGISPEDSRLGALKAGIAINRLQWEQVYADAALRTANTIIEELRNER